MNKSQVETLRMLATRAIALREQFETDRGEPPAIRALQLRADNALAEMHAALTPEVVQELVEEHQQFDRQVDSLTAEVQRWRLRSEVRR